MKQLIIFIVIFIMIWINSYSQEVQAKKYSDTIPIKVITWRDKPCHCVQTGSYVFFDSSKLILYKYGYNLMDTAKNNDDRLLSMTLSSDTLKINLLVNTIIPAKFEPVVYNVGGNWINIDFKALPVSDTTQHFIQESLWIKWQEKKLPELVSFQQLKIN